MANRFPRICPLCDKPGVINLSCHLEIIHDITGPKRSELLKEARVFRELKLKPNSTSAEYLFQPNEKRSSEPQKRLPLLPRDQSSPLMFPWQPNLIQNLGFVIKFSLLVVGPTQSRKTYFVKQVLTSDRTLYETKKQRYITWYYSQWQDGYEALKTKLGKVTQFFWGLPKFHDGLREIAPKCNNVLVSYDLMTEAIQGPIFSRLFPQGRHQNASVVLLLRNMFPKAKFNTDTSRNAQYIALFRKHIGIITERIFDKNRQRFMGAYNQETERAFGYLFVDNRPHTPGNKQVLGDIFGSCCVHPSINKSSKPEKRLEMRLSKNREVSTSCVTQSSRRIYKYFDLVWSEASWPVMQIYASRSYESKTIAYYVIGVNVFLRRLMRFLRKKRGDSVPAILLKGRERDISTLNNKVRWYY